MIGSRSILPSEAWEPVVVEPVAAVRDASGPGFAGLERRGLDVSASESTGQVDPRFFVAILRLHCALFTASSVPKIPLENSSGGTCIPGKKLWTHSMFFLRLVHFEVLRTKVGRMLDEMSQKILLISLVEMTLFHGSFSIMCLRPRFTAKKNKKKTRSIACWAHYCAIDASREFQVALRGLLHIKFAHLMKCETTIVRMSNGLPQATGVADIC
jgi:hypothetical protein